ncbi:MAG: hypothetical protein HDQ90_02490, partial [Desulfovibrio sp.]|nr:hypothetical protein [Desulfovibrio sp.]
FIVSDLIIERKAFRELAEKINHNSCFLLLGRRFSGKTAIMATICKKLKSFSHIIFPSNETCDERTIGELLSSETNTIFLFDSNSLSSEAYLTVVNSRDKIKKNNNKVIFFANSNDNFIVEHLDVEVIRIYNKFYKKNDHSSFNELNDFNKKANKYGLNNRRWGDTNLDYLNYIHQTQKITTSIDDVIKSNLTLDEKVIFILLCACDKIYYSGLLSFGLYPKDIKSIVDRFTPFLEIEPVKVNEYMSHSSHKLVHNSKLVLLNKLKELDNDDIRYCIEYIVKTYHDNKSKFRLYIEVILFDTLNQIFGGKSGAGHLIYSVYERLEHLLSNDLHYWLQRAKSIYRLFPKEYDRLREAYQYTKKVYNDSRENSPLYIKGALSTALISSLLYFMENDSREKILYGREVINLAHEVIYSNHFNNPRTGLKNELEGSINRKNALDLIIAICDEYIRSNPYGDLYSSANEIITELRKIK